MWWPLTLTYIFKVIRPWLWKSCPLCNVFSSRSIIPIFATNNHYHLRVCRVLFWLGIWYELLVWVIMGRRGVFSERKRSSCSSSLWFNYSLLFNDTRFILFPMNYPNYWITIKVMSINVPVCLYTTNIPLHLRGSLIYVWCNWCSNFNG